MAWILVSGDVFENQKRMYLEAGGQKLDQQTSAFLGSSKECRIVVVNIVSVSLHRGYN